MSYQFLEKDQESFESLGSAMNIVGLTYLALGGVNIALAIAAFVKGGAKASIGQFAYGAFFLAMGLMTRNAGNAFTKIKSEKDGDIAYLMKAVEEQQKFYGIQKTLILLLIAAVVLGAIFMYFG